MFNRNTFLKSKSFFSNASSNFSHKILLQLGSSRYFYSKSSKNFGDESQKEELKNLKASLNLERKSFLERVTDYFGYNKVSIVNHTNRDLNLDEIQKEIKELKRDDAKQLEENKKEDQKKLEEFFKIQKQFLSKQSLDENYMNKAIEILRKLKSIDSLYQDKRYNIVKDDLLFLTNMCNDPKILIKLMSFSFIFMKEERNGKTFQEFCENLAERTKLMLESTELADLLVIINFFTSLRNLDSVIILNLFEPFKNEIYRRLDKEFYLKTRMKNPFIENDEIAKILLVFDEGKLLDDSLVSKIIEYVVDNIENFGIKDLLEINLFFLEKKENSKEFCNSFENFFNRINLMKLKRNIKNMTLESLYDYSYIYCKLGKFKKEENVLVQVLEALMKTNSENKELSSIFLFDKSSPRTVTKFARLFENEITKTNEKLLKKFYSLISEYFVFNHKKFEIEDSFVIINLLKSKHFIDEDVLKKVLTNFYNNINKNDEKNTVKLCNFYLANPELELNESLVREFERIFRNSSNLNVCVEILFLLVRREQNLNISARNEKGRSCEETNFLFLNEENFSHILNKYETVYNLTPENSKSKNTLDIKNKVKFLLSLSYFYMPPLDGMIHNQSLFENKAVDNLIQKIIITKPSELNLLSIYEVMILIHSCRNFGKSKIKNCDPIFLEKCCELLKNIEHLVIKYLKQFSMIEFLVIFDIYTSRKIASHNLIEAFSELILSSIEQFSLIHLDVLIKGMEDVISYVTEQEKEKLKDESFKKNPFDIVKILRILKIRLETRVLEKSTEDVSESLIREVVKDFLKKEKESKMKMKNSESGFKKLI